MAPWTPCILALLLTMEPLSGIRFEYTDELPRRQWSVNCCCDRKEPLMNNTGWPQKSCASFVWVLWRSCIFNRLGIYIGAYLGAYVKGQLRV